MGFTLVIIVLALVAALFFLRVSRGHSEAISNLDDLAGRTQAVDLRAFRNLVDPAETLFLKRTLTPADFRRVHRERLRAEAEYVQRIAHNAAVLLRLGQAARTNPNPEIANAAASIVESALFVRMIAMKAFIKLRLQLLVPGIVISTIEVLDRYGRLTDSVALFTRLQRPAYASHVLGML